MLPSRSRLRSSARIKAVVTGGQTITSGSIVIHWLPGETTHSRIACVAGLKASPKAVTRHALQRKLRALAQFFLSDFPNSACDMVWIAKSDNIINQTPKSLYADLKPQFNQIFQS